MDSDKGKLLKEEFNDEINKIINEPNLKNNVFLRAKSIELIKLKKKKFNNDLEKENYLCELVNYISLKRIEKLIQDCNKILKEKKMIII